MRFPRCALVLVIALIQGGCFVGTTLEMVKSQPVGTVTLTSSALGDHTLAPTVCLSGERQLFLGADFLEGGGIVTRVIVDPAGGARLRFFSADHPLEEGILFRRKDCSRFELSFERNGWQINDVFDLRVSLDFDCRTESGDAAKGVLLAEHCH